MNDILEQIKAGEVSGVQFKERALDKYDIGCELVAFSNAIYLLPYTGIEVEEKSNQVEQKSNQVEDLDTQLRYLDTRLRYLDTRLRYLDTRLRYLDTQRVSKSNKQQLNRII